MKKLLNIIFVTLILADAAFMVFSMVYSSILLCKDPNADILALWTIIFLAFVGVLALVWIAYEYHIFNRNTNEYDKLTQRLEILSGVTDNVAEKEE